MFYSRVPTWNYIAQLVNPDGPSSSRPSDRNSMYRTLTFNTTYVEMRLRPYRDVYTFFNASTVGAKVIIRGIFRWKHTSTLGRSYNLYDQITNYMNTTQLAELVTDAGGT